MITKKQIAYWLVQTYLIVLTTAFLFFALLAVQYLSDGNGALAVLSLGAAVVMWMMIPSIEEPEET